MNGVLLLLLPSILIRMATGYCYNCSMEKRVYCFAFASWICYCSCLVLCCWVYLLLHTPYHRTTNRLFARDTLRHLGDEVDGRQRMVFHVLGVGHGYVGTGHAHDWMVQMIERFRLHDLYVGG